jgi:hypothetical protein
VTGKPRLARVVGSFVCVASYLLLAGCVSPTEILNPELLQTFGVAGQVASLPGDAPALLVEVENKTHRPIEFLLTWRDPEGQIQREFGQLPPDGKTGRVLFCPVPELTLGDVGNLETTGAIVRLGTGGSNDPFIEVESFGVLLQEGVNYDCGDSVTFEVLPSQATLSGYQVFAFIRRAQTPSEAGGS